MSDPNAPATPPADADQARGLVEMALALHQALRLEAENAGDTARVEQFDALIGQDVAALRKLKDDAGAAAATAARYEQLLADLDQES